MFDEKTVIGTSIATGAATGIGNATMIYTGAVAAAEAYGIFGAAAINSALATLGGGSIAAGGGGIAVGITTLITAAAWPAAAIAVTSYSGYKLYKWLR
jgi:hypothetical protein